MKLWIRFGVWLIFLFLCFLSTQERCWASESREGDTASRSGCKLRTKVSQHLKEGFQWRVNWDTKPNLYEHWLFYKCVAEHCWVLTWPRRWRQQRSGYRPSGLRSPTDKTVKLYILCIYLINYAQKNITQIFINKYVFIPTENAFFFANIWVFK